jgi:hypothetical protein
MNWWIIAHWYEMDCEPDLYKVEFPVFPTDTFFIARDHEEEEYDILYDTDYLVLVGPLTEEQAHTTLSACSTMNEVLLYQYLNGVSADE